MNDYFDRIFVINLASRPDRRKHAEEQLAQLGITKAEWFPAYNRPIDHNGIPNGNMGCTASHRAILEIIAYDKTPRTLVLEDDFTIAVNSPPQWFDGMIKEVPETWEMLYLGGHYGEPPIERVSPHVIRIGRMLTTSSYGITWQMARKMAPYICGIGPIDSLYGGFHNKEHECYIFDPRMFVQYANFSDLQDRDMDNTACMLDQSHAKAV